MAAQGTWNILGYNLPDYSVTENLGAMVGYGGSVQPTTFYNPAAAVPGQIGPAVTGTNFTTSTTPPAPTQTTQSPWTSAPQQTTQQPQQTTGSYQQQWEAAGHQGTAPVGYHGESGGASGGPSAQDLNAIYDPAMQTLNAQEAQYRSQLPGAEAAVGTSYQEGLDLLNKNLGTQEASLQKQQNTINTTKGSALAQARQLYTELAQKYGAMFGSRTSAGPAAMEILSRETQKQFGGIEQGATNATQDITGERTRLQSWVSDQTNTLQAKKRDAISGIQNTFAQGLASIAAQRGALESAKASARFDLLNQAKAQLQQVEAASTQFQNQLTMFQQEKQATMDQMQYAKQLGGFNAPAFTPSQIGTTGASQVTFDYVSGTYKNQYGQKTDQYGNIQQ